ncbi:MAG: hypothetical protein U0P46_13820 [Holophagaceae bacterium]|mgnify:CR=1 FL=1
MRLVLEMCLSREEFLRLLPGAVGSVEIQEEDGVFRASEGARRWSIRLSPLAPRRLGSVMLPCQAVEINLEGHSEAEAAAFLARFHRGFQRGGG